MCAAEVSVVCICAAEVSGMFKCLRSESKWCVRSGNGVCAAEASGKRQCSKEVSDACDHNPNNTNNFTNLYLPNNPNKLKGG
jgi:hypothetical protein